MMTMMTMIDFMEYSELYHYGVKGMHWGIRRYQTADGKLTPEGKAHKSLKDRASDAVDKLMSIDKDFVNRLFKTSARLRQEYSNTKKIKSEKGRQASAKRAKKYAKEYLKRYGKEPLSYIQYNNAKKGAAIGAVAGIVVPVILPLWATIPAGYVIGSKIKGKEKKG